VACQRSLDDAREEEQARSARELLERVLLIRFGPLDAATLTAIQGAGFDQVMDWGVRFFTAASLAEVFET
jgi:hypothetical protein